MATAATLTAIPRDSLVLAGNRPADVVAFEHQLISFFIDAAELLGVPKSVAAIYGIIFASPVPLSFADVEARLDISKGSISQGLQVLREMGAVKEISTAKDRVGLFEPDLELRKLASRFLDNRVAKHLKAGSGNLTSLGKLVPGGKGNEAVELRGRIKSLQDWHNKARALLPLAKTFLTLSG